MTMLTLPLALAATGIWLLMGLCALGACVLSGMADRRSEQLVQLRAADALAERLAS